MTPFSACSKMRNGYLSKNKHDAIPQNWNKRNVIMRLPNGRHIIAEYIDGLSNIAIII